MPTTPQIGIALAAVCTAAVTLAVTDVHPVSAAPIARHLVQLSRARGHAPAVAPAYGWPLKPFDRQHPVRGFLNDPRISRHGGHAFHFGIDISAADGTAVYAVSGGILHLGHGSLSVSINGHHEFGYWHVVAAVGLASHQIVHRHQLLGVVAARWGHVHFAERVRGVYVNPLRPGGLGPYEDPIAPVVSGIVVSSTSVGHLQVLARAHDVTWPRVRGVWQDEPVTPALIRWRVAAAGEPLGAWQTAVDFSAQMLDRRFFNTVYAPGSSQNHEDRPGSYAFYVAHDWQPADGTYRIEVAASDTRENTAIAALDVVVANGDVEH
jgi:hypothetical protein